MAGEVETNLRGPRAYEVARAAIDLMEAAKVWPTALNIELWLQLVSDPRGPLAVEIDRLLQSGAAITDTVAEELAAAFLPRGRLKEQIFDAGDALTRELASVSGAVRTAGQSARSYGQTLAAAGRELEQPAASPGLRLVVDTLTTATRKAQSENRWLDTRLAESAREVARLKEDLDQVRKDASTDGLTNLANRRAFDTELRRLCSEETADHGEVTVSVAVLDVDNFKRFNDTWGHQTGDQVLRFVSSVIGRLAAPPRFAARYGGEEFAILFSGESPGQIERVLSSIRQGVSSRTLRRRSTDEDLGSVTLSAGFAERWPGEAAESVMGRADAALYVSKRGGRDRITRSDTIREAG
ncbi:MAG TPA: GGDEF domain-containing protein [Caulobacteraceae bacterium]